MQEDEIIMEKIIELKNVRKTYKVHYRENDGLWAATKSLVKRNYKTVVALENMNFSVNKGDIHALLGSNGSGKSTTIKIMSGIIYPTEGSVKIMGYVPWVDRIQYVQKIGVVFGQRLQLNWELPAIDTYQLNRKIYKIDKKTYEERIAFLIDSFGLGDFICRPVRNLSLGERMKAELICALIHNPEIIFLDEPTIGMDIISKYNMRSFIKKVNEEFGTTVILTTHDLEDVEKTCNKVTVLSKGSIVFDDTLENLRGYYSKNKIVEIKFSKEMREQKLNGFNCEFIDPYIARMEIEDIRKFNSELNFLYEQYPISDIDITSPGIESVLKSIYEK